MTGKTARTEGIRFLLGEEARQLEDIDPNTTVLEYLRRVEGLTGTKEGCAEGDCGACTVVVAERSGDDGLTYRTVNACILFIGALDGRQLITVEHLQGAGGGLHPVQRAMVEAHASQCGFCTPGFVMSLFALTMNATDTPGRRRIDDELAGNLCRCTGYGPIIAAARQACKVQACQDQAGQEAGQPPAEARAQTEKRINQRLRRMESPETLHLKGRHGEYFAPKTAAALGEILARRPDATMVAGATDAGLWITKQGRRLDPMVYVGQVAELKEIHLIDEFLVIGAAVTFDQAHQAIAGEYADFGELIRRIGARQVRNQGTIGGNIANGSPIGDSPPALIALGATLVLNRGGGLREMPLEDFFIEYGRQDLNPGEFVQAVRLPRRRGEDGFRCYKVAKRFDQDISAVLGAFNITLENGRVARARICYGGMAGTPQRALACEQAIIGRPWTEETVRAGRRALRRDFTPMTDQRAGAAYRMAVAQNLLTKAHMETTNAEWPTRLVGKREAAHG